MRRNLISNQPQTVDEQEIHVRSTYLKLPYPIYYSLEQESNVSDQIEIQPVQSIVVWDPPRTPASITMTEVEPLTIHVSDEKLNELKQKLAVATFPSELEETEWTYGVPLEEVKRLTTYWRDKFDWRAQEARINSLPNFHTKIQVPGGFEPLDIHFVHQKSANENAIPLLFSHGWPGSFLEVTKILPLLVDPPDDGSNGSRLPSFHVVAPSLANFGFSSGTKKKSFGLKQHAEICHQLMQRLGYTQYVTQGGDWGTMITRIMALMFPSSVKATHINMVRGHKPKMTSNPVLYMQHALSPYTAAEEAGFERTKWFHRDGSGYNIEQATKPQTIGYSLTDSPVGLLAWIYEKLHDWTDGYPWSEDEVCTWISIYYFSTAGPAASVRLYYESMHPTASNPYNRTRTEEWIGGVKLGLSWFPRELDVLPKTWGRTMGPVVFEGSHDKGGHFAAWERPEILVDDLRKMFGKGGGAANAIPGRSGFVAKL